MNARFMEELDEFPHEIADWRFLLNIDYDHTAPAPRMKKKEIELVQKVLRQMNEFWISLRIHGPYMFRFLCPLCGLPFSRHYVRPVYKRPLRRHS